MKKLLNILAAGMLCLAPQAMFAQAPNLGTAANFVLFSTVGAVTNTGLSHLTGNVGTNSGSSTGFGNVNGVMHNNDGASGLCATDLLSAYNELNTAIPTFFPAPLMGNGDTLGEGVYHISGATTLNLNLTLNAAGNANAIFIFQIQGPLSINAAAKVKLINGAKACNVFWKVEGLVSMGAGATMRGTIVANNAAINLNANDTLEGRALSTTGAVTVNGVLAYTPIGCSSPFLTGPAAPALGATACYGLFSSNGPVTNSGTSHIGGDVGTNVGLTTAYNPLFVTGTVHPIPDVSTDACAADLLTVYNYLNTLAYDIELLHPEQFGHGLVLTPHTYLMNAAASLTDSLYLDAEGNANAVFVIKVNGALSTSVYSRVILINGTQAKNVYWKTEGAVQINDYSVFNGTIVCNNAALNLYTGVTLNGRALVKTGALGTTAITTTLTAGCGTTCVAPVIGGTASMCEGSTTTLSNTSTGGTWSSSNTATATAGASTGIITGVAAGTASITYTTTGGCVSTVTVTINALPAPVTGAAGICTGTTTALHDATSGGTWSSSTTSVATIGSITGIATGHAAGTATISYLMSGCARTRTVTVNALPIAITGTMLVCPASTTTLHHISTGGTWTSSNAHVTIGAASGIATGVTVGTATITYTPTADCISMAVVTVNASVAPVVNVTESVSGMVCNGTSVTYYTIPVNGGAAPTYTWAVNGTATGTTGSAYSYAPANGDVVTATMHSSLACALPAIATHTLSMTIAPNVMPSISIDAAPGNSVCMGDAVTFTSSSVYGGTGATYAWIVNGVNTSAATSYSYTPADHDTIYCRLSSTAACRLVNDVQSANTIMAVHTGLIPTLNIAAINGTSVIAGTADTFQAVVINGGSAPAYQWYVNATAATGASATSTMFVTSTLVNNDSISCKVSNTDMCGFTTFNSLKVTVNATTGVSQNAQILNTIQLIPNPNNGSFIVRGTMGVANEEVNLEVTDMLGQIVYRSKTLLSNGGIDQKIAAGNILANGIYLLHIKSASGDVVLHFAVQQ